MPLIPHVSTLREWEHPASWHAGWCLVLTVRRADFGVLIANPGGVYIDVYLGWLGFQFDWGEQ